MAYNRGKTGRKYDVIYALFALVLGMFLAWVTGDIGGRGLIGNVLVHYGIWLFAGSLLAFYAGDTLKSGIAAFACYGGAVCAYTLYVYLAGGGGDMRLFIYRLILAVIGALICIASHNAHQKEWVGGICAAVAPSLMIAEGYPAFYSRSYALIFELILACVLYLILARGRDKRLMGLPFVIVFACALIYFDAFNRIFGGWI